MKILMANKYFYRRGGSEAVYFDTSRLLENNGHEVIHFSMRDSKNEHSPFSDYFLSKQDFSGKLGLSQRIKASGRILYSIEAKKKFKKLIESTQPDIVHLHNIYHQISPSILSICRKFQIPTLMTLHDYKLLCPIYTLYTKGRACERCLYGKYYWCLLKRCQKGLLSNSFLNALEMYLHIDLLRLYDKVNAFICPSRFILNKMKAAEFPGNLVHLPNFVWLAGQNTSFAERGESIAYIGRISHEKGLHTLITALTGLDVRCQIIGEGPLKNELEFLVQKESMENIVFTGALSEDKLKDVLKKCRFVVLPSEWYENNPRSILEAFALGKPVLGSNIGGIPELIEPHVTGLLFQPGDASDLREKILYLWHNPLLTEELGRMARNLIVERYAPDRYYEKLMDTYESVRKGSV
jgi:glycosyltransferase involved in cell wall biosynthesis